MGRVMGVHHKLPGNVLSKSKEQTETFFFYVTSDESNELPTFDRLGLTCLPMLVDSKYAAVIVFY